MSAQWKKILSAKILLAIFPAYAIWIAAGGLLLGYVYLAQGEGDTFFRIGNFGLALVSLRLATIIHELGHLTAAKLVGASPRRLVLGYGHEVDRIVWKNFTFIVNAQASGGYVHATWPDSLDGFVWRRALYVLGGIITNMSVALLFYLIFGIQEFSPGINFTTGFIIVNAFALINLVPLTTFAWGWKHGSDGMQLIRLLRNPSQYKDLVRQSEVAMHAVELFEKKEFLEACTYLEAKAAKENDAFYIEFYLATAYVKLGLLGKAFSLVQKLADGATENSQNRNQMPLVHNLTAWVLMLQGKTDEALKYASDAFAKASKSNIVRGTYANALAAAGQNNEAIKVGLRNADLRYVNSTTLTAAMALMTSYHLVGNKKFSQKYRSFVERHITNLDPDEKTLFNMYLEKMNQQQGVELIH